MSTTEDPRAPFRRFFPLVWLLYVQNRNGAAIGVGIHLWILESRNRWMYDKTRETEGEAWRTSPSLRRFFVVLLHVLDSCSWDWFGRLDSIRIQLEFDSIRFVLSLSLLQLPVLSFLVCPGFETGTKVPVRPATFVPTPSTVLYILSNDPGMYCT